MIEKKQSAGGVWFMLKNERGTWYVFKLCANYAAHVKGGLAHEWRYTDKTKDESEARKAFAKRLTSKAAR